MDIREEVKKQPKIPPEAFKQVRCNCGCDTFSNASLLMQYPGGMWSAKPVTAPIPLMICSSCGKPYVEKLAILIDRPKNGANKEGDGAQEVLQEKAVMTVSKKKRWFQFWK